MGRSRGGGKPLSNNDRVLRRHIEAVGKNYSTVEELADNLRSCYPMYARHKLRPFTKQVERIVMASSRSNDAMDESDGDSSIAKKRRKIDDKDEKYQLIEADHEGHPNRDGVGFSSSQTSVMMQSEKLGEDRTAKEAMELEGLNGDAKLVNEKLKICGNYETENSDRTMFKDLGGIGGVIEELEMDVILPLYHPQLFRHLGVKPVVGILLHGPPGCGKTRLAHAIANETGVPLYKVSAAELVSGVSGESEENIRELFTKAYRTSPSIVFIDEIDAIASKRDNLQREMEKRIVTQLMTCMDPVDGEKGSDHGRGHVLVIGATNRPDALDPALRRTGRFDREIALGVPDEAARVEILSVVTRKLNVKGALDLVKIARSTPGFVGADLSALANKAATLALKRIVDKRKSEYYEEHKDGDHNKYWLSQPWSDEDMENLITTMADFEEAAKDIQPSLRREGFSTIPNVKWDDVGGLHSLREEFDHYIVGRIKFPKIYEEFGLDMDTGFLLYGPPGCGKTLIAKAVANEAGANFIHIKGPQLLNKYVGESESAVRTIFSRARACSPCIIFFDEVDALTTERGKEGGWVVERLLNQLLIELDGAEERKGVYVIGATNRIDVMDPALLRPGRFGQLMYVPLPSPDERGVILKALSRKRPIDANVDLMALGKDTRLNNFSGADLNYLVVEAAKAAFKDKLSSSDTSSSVPWTMKDAHFKSAFEKVSPSVSNKQRQHYKYLSESLRA